MADLWLVMGDCIPIRWLRPRLPLRHRLLFDTPELTVEDIERQNLVALRGKANQFSGGVVNCSVLVFGSLYRPRLR